MSSSSRWRILTAYLPGIASVVNSFQSNDVQVAVYQELMKALDEKTESEEMPAATSKARTSRGGKSIARDVASSTSDSDLAYDIVEGESIHALMGKS